MNKVIKIFNYQFYVKELLVVFFGYLLFEGMFFWLLAPDSNILNNYEKLASFLIFGFMVYSINKLRSWERVYVIIFSLFIIKLIFESLFEFNTVFQQLTMFYVLFPVIFALFVKHFNRYYDLDLLEFLARFYITVYIIFMAIYGRGFSFNLSVIEMDDYGQFSGDGRILHSTRIYMMVIPYLYYLHKFVQTYKNKFLVPLLFCSVVILIHQHRSVWSCTIVATLIHMWLSVRINTRTLPRFSNIALNALVVIFIAYFFISSMFPTIIDFFAARFSEIFDPAKEDSTGKFRADQRETYFKLFLQRPLFGWTFEGFEMPNPLVDWWPEKTGQHFHEGYMEVLFYHGIAGFVFKFTLFVYIAIKAFSKKLTENSIILIAFCLSGLLYQLNYVLPTTFWAHLGLCLYYIEKDEDGPQLNYDLEEEQPVLQEDYHPHIEYRRVV